MKQIYNLNNQTERLQLSKYIEKMNGDYDRFIESLSFKQYNEFLKISRNENDYFEKDLKIDSITKSEKILILFDNWIKQVKAYRKFQIIEREAV